MKYLVLILLLTIQLKSRAIELIDAFNDPDISITITGFGIHDDEIYADKEIRLGILNKKGYPVTITAEPGFILDSEEDDVQNMIITEPLYVEVKPELYAEAGLNAMCIQASNRSPWGESSFIPWKYADGNLAAIVKYVYENNLQNDLGQDAVWAVSDGQSVYDITGNPEIANPVRQYVADLKHEAFDTSLVRRDVQYVDRYIKEYALYLKFYLYEKDDIKLQVFDHKGEFKRDLIARPGQAPGKYEMKYKISLSGMLGQKYFVRLYVGDEMRNEFTLFIKDS